MPRQTSTASSSKRAWPSTASSRRAHRSRSGSWRSPPGCGWRLERCLSRNAAGALGGAGPTAHRRGAPEVGPTADTPRRIRRIDRRPDGCLLHRPRDPSCRESGEVRAGGWCREPARRAPAAHPDRNRRRGPDRRQRRRQRPSGGRLPRTRRHGPLAARALRRPHPGRARAVAALGRGRVRDRCDGLGNARRTRPGARPTTAARICRLGRARVDARLPPGARRLLAARLTRNLDRRSPRLAARRRPGAVPDREARPGAARRRAQAPRTERGQRFHLAHDGDSPDRRLDDRALGRRRLADANPRRLSPDMKGQTMDTPRSAVARGGVLAILALVLLGALTGCGVGRASNQEKVSKTVVTYLRALADGDTANACAQLTRRAQDAQCQQVLKERQSRLDPNALTSAADASLDLNIHGNTATAGLSDPEGARLVLAKTGGEWRIDSGYTLGPTPR